MTSNMWLTTTQQQAWRNWLAVSAQLPAALHRQLQETSELSLQDFDVMVHLSESPDQRARVSDLAQALQWERSRLSHHVKRMEKRGLVSREECADDGRGAFVVLSDLGKESIHAVAPDHVATVKRLVFDALSDADVEALTAVTSKMLARLSDS